MTTECNQRNSFSHWKNIMLKIKAFFIQWKMNRVCNPSPPTKKTHYTKIVLITIE